MHILEQAFSGFSIRTPLNSITIRAFAPMPALRLRLRRLGMPRLSVSMDGNTREYDFDGELTLGRNKENGVVLPQASVSRLHARIVSGANGAWLLESLSGARGT